ncbi:hypothetical protein EVAR_16182_1 [Eumeta japonica]|uniref:Reverse transcriptase RNase H-like domain-containing protein n=1 Tax=Eumeta variegata TaxID=151549 RepID=A0A4C1WBT3_EUMVA|nr:hypothetical protein EVAR_16182_1 [Eumeta japonica]
MRLCLKDNNFISKKAEPLPLALRAHVEAELNRSYGLGAVLLQYKAGGSERPVSCASCTLNTAERNYSQRIVNDNVPPFSSAEFGLYLNRNVMKHILIAPYHLASNLAAMVAIHSFKLLLKKVKIENKNDNTALSRFLFSYKEAQQDETQVRHGSHNYEKLESNVRLGQDSLLSTLRSNPKTNPEQSPQCELVHLAAQQVLVGRLCKLETICLGNTDDCPAAVSCHISAVSNSVLKQKQLQRFAIQTTSSVGASSAALLTSGIRGVTRTTMKRVNLAVSASRWLAGSR